MDTNYTKNETLRMYSLDRALATVAPGDKPRAKKFYEFVTAEPVGA